MAEAHVQVTVEAGVLKLGLNRPDKKNALTQQMYLTLTEALAKAESDPQVRVVLIHGSDECFTSGNDLNDFLGNPPKDGSSPVADYLAAIHACPKPIVGAVNGLAIGIGATMLLHFDLVYAAKTAVFEMSFVDLGLCPEAGSTFILPAMMGHHRAAQLVLLAERYDAARAHELGLVNEVTAAGHCLEIATAATAQLAAKPPRALRTTKALLKASSNDTVLKAMAAEGAEFIPMLTSPEAREAMSARLEKRAPHFSTFA